MFTAFSKMIRGVLAGLDRQPTRSTRPSVRSRATSPARSPFRPALEALEDRQLMTVGFTSGSIIQHVEAQPVYYGSDWALPTVAPTAAYLDNFVNSIVNSSYMDMLGNAGYKDNAGNVVGRGTFSPSVTIATSPAIKTTGVTDAGLQSVLQNAITNGTVQQPDSNRLYILYVEPGVAISMADGTTSKSFLGYHSSFTGKDSSGATANIRYAVMAYPASPTGSGFLATVNNNLTASTSHELAEAVTDPDARYSSMNKTWIEPGWVDPASGKGEVGDIAAGQFVYLNGFAVQRIADKNDQAMTPAGATSATQCTFILQANNTCSWCRMVRRHSSAAALPR